MARDSSWRCSFGPVSYSTNPSPFAELGQQRFDFGESLVDRLPSSVLRSSTIGRTEDTAVWEPSTFAWKSHRSVWLKMSSSPVILLMATSSRSP